MPDEEREAKIQEALRIHHNKVKEKYSVVMTVLCGSQNYRLDTESSDYDTFTFVLPSVANIAMLKEPVSIMTEDEYGHIEIKDIRLALNLLKKTSPNSVEWFATGYRIIEPEYTDLFDTYITPETLRCSTKHMMAAIGGLAHQLTKRNISPGKRYSHLLRMECMVDNYYNLQSDILSLTEVERIKALKAKMLQNTLFYDRKCFELERRIKEKIESYSNVDMSGIEKLGMTNVSELQVKLFKVLISK